MATSVPTEEAPPMHYFNNSSAGSAAYYHIGTLLRDLDRLPVAISTTHVSPFGRILLVINPSDSKARFIQDFIRLTQVFKVVIQEVTSGPLRAYADSEPLGW
ncbi:Hypothetical protein D9617_9g025010 [Elsinoe fawcettii]|nr:Hypothetical protein D9617_9g025010 [Elsinoe fawcettii]